MNFNKKLSTEEKDKFLECFNMAPTHRDICENCYYDTEEETEHTIYENNIIDLTWFLIRLAGDRKLKIGQYQIRNQLKKIIDI